MNQALKLTNQERSILRLMDRMKKIHIYELNPELSPAEGQLLVVLSRKDEGVTVSELAKKTEVPMPAISRMMKPLEERHLIVRSISPSDRRSIIVTLTKEGQDTVNHLLGNLHHFFSEVMESFDPDDFDKMICLCNEMMEKMEIVLEKQLAQTQAEGDAS